MMEFFLQIGIFILIIIFVHFLWNYMKDTMTIRKKKYIQSDIEKYKSLLDLSTLEMRKGVEHPLPPEDSYKPNIDPLLPPLSDYKEQEQELNAFLDNLLANNNEINHKIDDVVHFSID